MRQIISEMAGIVRAIMVEPGQQVTEGQELLLIEAMKMEIPVESPLSGRVRAIRVATGQAVARGAPLLELD